MSSSPWLIQQKIRFTGTIHINTAYKIPSTTRAKKKRKSTPFLANFLVASFQDNEMWNWKWEQCAIKWAIVSVRLKPTKMRHREHSLRHLAINDRRGYFNIISLNSYDIRMFKIQIIIAQTLLTASDMKMRSQAQIEAWFAL